MQLLPLHDALPQGIDVYRLDFDLTAEPTFIARSLMPDEQIHTHTLRQRADRVRFAGTRSAVRWLLAKRLECTPQQVRFGKGEQGKPFVQSAASGLPVFNVAHSGTHGLIAIGDGATMLDIGIDIEQCDATLDAQAIMDIAFTPDERAEIRAAAHPFDAFYQYWTAKEAVLKTLGVGIADHLQSISIRKHGLTQLNVRHSMPAWSSIRTMILSAPSGYAAALAWRTKEAA